MILVDTSVLVSYLKSASPTIEQMLSTFECGICGVTRAEVLHGARTSDDAKKLITALDSLQQVVTGQSTWDRLGHNLALLRARGLPMPFQDVLIATIAIEQSADLWTYDAHFQLIGSVLPQLKLFEGPMP